MRHPGFRLNLHDRESNPCFESHDPSMMWDPVGKMYYSYATDSAITSPFKQGIPVRRSKDLVNFEYVGTALSDEAVAEGRDNGPDFKPTGGFWAPYTEYCNGEYRMYYSATKAFGSSESRIWLAVAEKPEGPFENRGVVMDTWDTPDTDPNAIDAHVEDTADGRKYFIYGSFFGGIFCKELNPETGMPINPDAHYQGIRLAKKPADSHVDGPEGAAVMYHPDTKYYYLFLSYGWLGENYDIRVGRCREITGPYVDFHGKSLDGESLGTKLAGSYSFESEMPWAGEVGEPTPWGRDRRDGEACEVEEKKAGCKSEKSDAETEKSELEDKPKKDWRDMTEEERAEEIRRTKLPHPKWQFSGFRGPGHGVPFYAPDTDEYFFVHHVRDGAECFKNVHHDQASYRMHYMVVRRMYFVNDWPVFSPEPFAGESKDVMTLAEYQSAECQDVATGKSSGRIGSVEDGEAGAGKVAWEWLQLKYADNTIATAKVADLPGNLSPEKAYVFKCFDFENSREVLALSGMTDDGECIWGKLVKLNK